MRYYNTIKMMVLSVGFLGLAALPAVANADLSEFSIENAPLQLNYTAYVGGVRALEIEVFAQMGEGVYALSAEADTVGFVADVADWHTRSQSYGIIDDDGVLHPIEAFISHTRRGVEKRREMQFDEGGMIDVQEYKRGEEREPETGGMDIEERRDAVDVLAGMFALSHFAGNGEVCSQNVPLFDGQRRVNYLPELVGTRDLLESRYALYSGESVLCEIDFEAVGGFDRRDRRGYFYQNYSRDSREEGQPARIWLAQIEEGGPMVPVRLMVRTMMGNAVLHLTAYEELSNEAGIELEF